MNLEVFKQFAKKAKNNTIGLSNLAVIYTRVSSKDQFDKNASLQTQLKYCLDYAERKDLKVVERFGGTYESAKSDERKEFQRMLSYVKRKKDISYIIVFSYDRFSRTGANGAYISEQLKKQGIAIISATQEIDTSTSAGVFQENLYHIFSHFDNQLRRDKSITGMQEKLRKGYWTGAYPFGYTNANPGNGKNPNFVINAKGKILKHAFIWKANLNMSHAEIARRLEKKGLILTDKKLSKLFRNPFYCGIIVNKLIPDEVIQGKHQPLISKDVFLKIHNLLNSGKEPRKYSFDDENLPLKTFITSTECNTPYTGYIVKKKKLYYYKNRRKGSKENISAIKLHEQFTQTLDCFSLSDRKYVEPLKEIIYDTFIKMNEEKIQEKERIQQEIKALESKMHKLNERYVLLGDITQSQFNMFYPKLEQEKVEKEQQLEENKLKSSNLKKSINLALQHALNLSYLWTSGDLETKRAIQYMVFPDGIQYDFKNKAVRTLRINSVFSAISSISKDLEGIKKGNNCDFSNYSLLVESERIELSSKQVTKELSTRLVFTWIFDYKLVKDNLLIT